MASLTETAQLTRKFIKFSAIALVLIVIGRGLWKFGLEWYRKRNPPPPPPPTVSFGKLPRVNFPEKTQPELTYKLQTVSNTTPDLGDRAHVYFMPYLRPSLLALDRAKQQAEQLGFKSEPSMVDVKHYRWDKPEEQFQLTMNIYTGEIEMEYNWRQDSSLLNTTPPGHQQAIAEAKQFLQQAQIFPADLQLGETKTSYLKLVQNELVPAVSPSEADFVRVDFFRQGSIQEPIFTASATDGVAYMLISGAEERIKKVVKLSYHYFPVDYENSATYPLKPANTAFRELQTRKGYVATKGNNDEIITIRRIYLGYFDSKEPQQYLQPIYIFEGDNGFVAYVSALDNKWVE